MPSGQPQRTSPCLSKDRSHTCSAVRTPTRVVELHHHMHAAAGGGGGERLLDPLGAVDQLDKRIIAGAVISDSPTRLRSRIVPGGGGRSLVCLRGGPDGTAGPVWAPPAFVAVPPGGAQPQAASSTAAHQAPSR
jgi:hypothetical protein